MKHTLLSMLFVYSTVLVFGQQKELLQKEISTGNNVDGKVSVTISCTLKKLSNQPIDLGFQYQVQLSASYSTEDYTAGAGGAAGTWAPNAGESDSKNDFFSSIELINYQNYQKAITDGKIDAVEKWLNNSKFSVSKANLQTALNNDLALNKIALQNSFFDFVTKSISIPSLNTENLSDPLAGYLVINSETFIPSGISNKCRVSYVSALIKDSKLLILGARVTEISSGNTYDIEGTTSYPICLSNNFQNQTFGPIACSNNSNAKSITINVSNLLEYIPPKNNALWGFNVETIGDDSLQAGSRLIIHRKKLPDLINVTGFYHWYDAFSNPSESEGESNKNGRSNAQVELNINLPLWDKNFKNWQGLNKANFTFNFSPLGRGTPFYYLDVTDTNKVLKGFELTRNYYLQSSLNLTLFQVNLLQKSWLHSIQLDFGLNFFATKIRTNSIIDTSGNRLIDYDHFTSVNQIGPNLSVEYNNKWNDLLGFSFKTGMKFINTTEGQNYSFRKFRNSMDINEGYDRWTAIYALELNMFIMPFAKNNANSSGFVLRYRFWDDVNSPVDLHHEFMVGYALNINTLLK